MPGGDAEQPNSTLGAMFRSAASPASRPPSGGSTASGGSTPSTPSTASRPEHGQAGRVLHDLVDRALEGYDKLRTKDVVHRATGVARDVHHIISQNVAPAVRSPGPAPAPMAPSDQPAVLDFGPVRPGARGEAPVEVENASSGRVEVRLVCQGMVSANLERLGSQYFSFAPQIVVLEPAGQARIMAQVDVPEEAKAGRYMGIMSYENRPGSELVVTLHVPG